MFGRGQILRIDLSGGNITQEPIPPELSRTYVGGEGINSRLLWEHFLEVDPKIDPLSPENVLIAGVGPLAGIGYGSKMKWTFKSPACNMFGDSASGGNFVTSLRWAGYDHVVITGKASKPVYIWIDDDEMQIRDAAGLWGKDAQEADHVIKKEIGDDEIETALIGQGAENLVAMGSIIVSRHRAAGRTGGGTVMASKNLKGIAVRGTRGTEIYDPEALFAAVDEIMATINENAQGLDLWKRYGTIRTLGHYNKIGISAPRNNQGCMVPPDRYDLIDHRWYTENLAIAPLSCPGCAFGCSSIWKIKGNESAEAKLYAGESGSRPELGAQLAWGAMCDIADWPTLCHFWHKCDRYGIDVLEVGATCAFLMELWQRGIVDEKDTAEWLGEPIRLEWGDADAVDRMIDAIGLQSNRMGEILKGGVYRAAQMIEELKGKPVLQYALYGKGGAAFVEDVRNTPSWALNMAVASRGCDHLKGMGTLDKVNRPDISMLYFGTPDGAQFQDITLKGASSALAENRCALLNSLGVCVFLTAADPIAYPAEVFSRAVLACTGEQLTAGQLNITGERVVNLEKAFNSRLGYRREHDRICQRWMKEPMPEGMGKGWKAEDYLEGLKDEYYEWHGWDKETSLPTRKKLEELGMLDVAEVLQADNALA
jgi:aldehyde:ferredoxin oxidoreductase